MTQSMGSVEDVRDTTEAVLMYQVKHTIPQLKALRQWGFWSMCSKASTVFVRILNEIYALYNILFWE